MQDRRDTHRHDHLNSERLGDASLRDVRLLDAARRFFSLLGDALDARFSVRLWDGSTVPLGQNVDTPF